MEAIAPIIVSASRSTDIPAFYSEWFFHRLERGYSVWTNPFNGVPSYIAYQNTRFIVFWSKNPRPLLAHLGKLEDRGIGCYIQFSLNDYEIDGLEKGVPPLQQRIDTFRQLVDKLGRGHVVWRFDPMILTDRIGVDELIARVRNIGDQLNGYTEKLVFSYADIAAYRRVKANLDRNHIPYREWEADAMTEFARKLSQLNTERGWNFELATCGEKIGLESFGIRHNRCIDDDLIIRLASHDAALMDYLKVELLTVAPSLFGEVVIPDNAVRISDTLYGLKRKDNKDKGQRQFCGCIASKDIGQYNTCPHLCEYCYANASKDAALANYKQHHSSPLSDRIVSLTFLQKTISL